MMFRMGLASVALLAATPALATTSISGTVNAGVLSQLGAVTDTQTNTSSAVAPIVVQISAQANASASDAGATNTSFSAIVADWTSADSGDIGLVWGWNVNAAGYGSATLAETNLPYPVNWQYTFIASGNGVFSGRYNVLGAGDTFGLQPLYTTNDWTSGTLGGTVFDPTGSGTFSVALISGHTYTMSIANFGNISAGGGFVANGSADSNIQWQITYAGTPEPASWALLIAGFGLTGAAMRRRKTIAA